MYRALRGLFQRLRSAQYALFLSLALFIAPPLQSQPVVSSPLPGAQLRGVIPIIGTTDVANFTRYELSFGYDPNPTNTWFLLTDAASARVNSELYLWDTTAINDGTYMVRLRVYDAANNAQDYLLTNISVVNDAPVVPVTRAPAATATAVPPTVTPTALAIAVALPTATPVQLAIDTVDVDQPSAIAISLQPFTEALLRGVLLTGSLAVVFGAYRNLRRRYRYKALAWWRELKARSRR